MTRVTDFNNTWCYFNDHVHRALIKHKFKPNSPIDLGCHDKVNLNNYVIYPVHIDNKYATNGKQIKLIDNDFYYVDEEKEEDSFSKFGFETKDDFHTYDFETLDCNHNILGCVDGDATIWDKNGVCIYTLAKKGDYNLTPIKKPWYENEDNFPCLCYNIIANKLEIIRSINGILKSDYRPATKEEILKLVVDED